MIMSKNAVSNLIARYKTILQNCTLLNTFGTLAVATALAGVMLGGASTALAASSYSAHKSTYAITPDGAVVDASGATQDWASYDASTGTVTLNLDGTTLSGSTGTTYGVISNIALSGTADKVSCNIIVNGGMLSDNQSSNAGGAMTLWTQANLSEGSYPYFKHEINGTTFENNSATNIGGALFIARQASFDDSNGAAGVSITSSAFTRNEANKGGAIYNESDGIVIADSNFTSNVATTSGGAIYNEGEVAINSAEFIGNIVGIDADESANDTRGYGGAIYTAATTTNSGAMTIKNTDFSNNKAIGGGTSLSASGGAIYASKTQLTIDGGTFSGNFAEGTGGALGLWHDNATATYKASSFSIANATFSDNESSRKGGAIAFLGWEAYNGNDTYASYTDYVSSVAKSTFERNTSDFGGAIYAEFAALTVSASSFTDNKASTDAGAIYNNGISSTITDSTFTSNTASANGGAIYNNAGSITFSGTNTFSANTANGVLNDIYNAGTINVFGNLTLDGGITGSGATNFSADSVLTITKDTSLSNVVTTAGAKLVVTGIELSDGSASVDLAISGTIAENSWGYTTDSATVDANTIAFDSAFYTATSTSYGDGTYTVVVSQVSVSDALGDTIDTGLAGLIDTAISSNTASAGVDFIKSASTQEGGGTIIEGATKLAATGAVVPGLGSVNTAAVSNTGTRTSVVGQSKVTAASDTSTWLAMNGDGIIFPTADASKMTQGFGMWLMPMLNHTSADGFKSGSNSYGYDSNIMGISLGADYTFADDLRLGLAFNVGSGSSRSTGDFATTENNFDYYGFTAYGAKRFADFGLSFDMGYTMSQNTMEQSATGGNLQGNVDAGMVSLGLKGEYIVALDGFNVTPYAGLRFNYYDVDGYDTTQNGSALFSAARSESTVWEIPVGVSLDTTIQVGSWDMTPSLGLGVKFAAGDLDAEQKVSISGIDGTAVLSSEVADEFTFQGALGLAFAKDVCTLSLNYNLDLSENVKSHGMSLNLRYDF